MKVSVINIQQGKNTFMVSVSVDGQNQTASVSKNGVEIKKMKYKKDVDISVDLKDIITSDITNKKL